MASPQTATENTAYYKNWNTSGLWKDILSNLTISSITWKNLPDTIDPIYLEKSLFYTGSVIFFATKEGLVCLKGFGTSKPNLYNIPTQRVVHAANGFTATLDNNNSVICYNDVLHRNGLYKANIYANRLADIDNTIDVNCTAQKTPILLKADKNNKVSVENAFMQFIGNSPAIAVTEDFNPDAIKVFNIQAPFNAPQLRELQHDIFAEYCTSVGIANSNNYKAERLITSEVYSNNAGVLIQQQARLKPRQQVCDILNSSPFFRPYLTKGPVSVGFEVDAVDEVMAINPMTDTIGGQDESAQGSD